MLFIPRDIFFPSSILFKFEEMNSEMEESRELADNRLIELQKLQQDLQTVHQENSNMEVDLRFSHTNYNALLQYSMNYGGTPQKVLKLH